MPTTPDRSYRLRRPLTTAWREPEVLQLGCDTDGVILDGVPAGIAEVVAALHQPRTLAELTRLVSGLPEPWLAWFLDWLDHTGRLELGERSATQVGVVGSGPLADAIAALLRRCAELDVLRLANLHPRPLARRAAGAPLTPVLDWNLVAAGWPRLLVVATDTVEPDRALTDALARAGHCHLVVRLAADRAVVGPLVEPGTTPCLRCLDLVRGAGDPAWPRVLSQLCRARHQPDPVLLTWATATTAGQVRARLAGAVPDLAGRTLEFGGPDHALTTREWQLNPDCGCAGMLAA
ncbi:MAG: hypothetical protein VB036_13995 [Propionicimonas sp.]|nr:hypothetical protein [Propionicimonas sp.]